MKQLLTMLMCAIGGSLFAETIIDTPTSETVQSVSGQTTTYSGGTADGVTPNFEPSHGGTLNLVGGTYEFGEIRVSNTQTTLNIDGTVEKPVVINIPEFRFGMATITINEHSNIETTRLVISDGYASRTTTITQNGGLLKVTGSDSALSQDASALLGHWRGTSTYTLAGGRFEVPNAAIVMGNAGGTHAFDVAGGTAVAQGFLLSGNATGSNTLKIRNGSVFEVGSRGIRVNSGGVLAFTIDDGTLATSANSTSNAPLVVGVGGAIVDTVSYTRKEDGSIDTTVPPTSHTVTFSGAVSGAGQLSLSGAGTLAWGNASLPQSVEVGDGSTLNVTTNKLVMAKTGQNITATATGKVQLPETLTIDLAGRDLVAEGTVILIANVETFTDKTITVTNALGVRLDYPAMGTGNLTATYSADDMVTWDSASGEWINGSTSVSPWLNEGIFADGKDVIFGDVSDVIFGDVSDVAVATVTISGVVTPLQLLLKNTTTAYTFEDATGGGSVTGVFNTKGTLAPITFNNTIAGKIIVDSDGVTIKKLSPAATTLEVAANRAVTFDGVVWDYDKITKQGTSEFIFANTASAEPLTALPWYDKANVTATIQCTIGSKELPGDKINLGKTNQKYTFGAGADVIIEGIRTADSGSGNTLITIEEGAKITVTGEDNGNDTRRSILFGHWNVASTVNMAGGTFTAEHAQVRLGWSGRVTWNQTGGTTNAYGLLLSDRDGMSRLFALSNGMLQVGAGGIAVEATGAFRLGAGAIVNFAVPSTSTFVKAVEVTGGATLLAPNGATLSMQSGATATPEAMLTLGDGTTSSSVTIDTPSLTVPITVAAESTLAMTILSPPLRQVAATANTYKSDDLVFTGIGTDNFDYLHTPADIGRANTVTEFTGTFEVKTTGDYTFAGTWDDHIQLKVKGAESESVEVFSTSGWATANKGTINLTAGPHDYRIRLFNDAGPIGPGVEGWGDVSQPMGLGWAAGTLDNTTATNYTKFDVGGALDAAITNITPTPITKPSSEYGGITLQSGSTFAIMSPVAVPIHLNAFTVPATDEATATLELRGTTFKDGDVVLTWDPTTVTGDLSTLLRTFKDDTRFSLSIDATAGTATVSRFEITLSGDDSITVSDAALDYIKDIVNMEQLPLGVSITEIQISRSDANKAYLLNVIPSFVQGSESSILVATLNCDFRVTVLQIVGSGVDATITATATIDVTTGTKNRGVDGVHVLNGSLELLSGATLKMISTPVSVISTDPSALTVKGTFVEGNPFYKMIVVDTPGTPETPVE